MAFVNAFRHEDVATIVTLHHYERAPDASVAQQQRLARHEWRKLIRRYVLSGYRVTELSGGDRQRLKASSDLALKPIKKLVITLEARDTSARLELSHYIGALGGRYFFIPSNGLQ